ncbi:MAG TPA: hypothetical protein VF582_02165 [Allosphingosinicella sp.]
MIGNFYPFSTAPAPYDIVWCHFPTIEEPSLPAAKPRPALVRQAFQDQDGNAWVRVVFGTSKDPYSASLGDFTIATLAEMNVCGLKCATRFRLSREVDLPWTREYFACLPGKPTPIIGHMPAYEVKKLQTQISYIQQRFAEWKAMQDDEEERARGPDASTGESRETDGAPAAASIPPRDDSHRKP